MYSRCNICKRKLTNPTAQNQGVGKVCKKKYNYKQLNIFQEIKNGYQKLQKHIAN